MRTELVAAYGASTAATAESAAGLRGGSPLRAPEEKAAPVLRLLDGVAALVIQFVKLGMKLAPIGVFALIADALVSVAPDDPGQLGLLLRALGGYFLTLTLALAVQTFVVFPLLLRAAAQVNIIDFPAASPRQCW